MRQLFFAVACIVLIGCEDILPVENVDLCEGDKPASADCDQCQQIPRPAGCPQCRGLDPDHDCANASPTGGKSGSNSAASGGKSGTDGRDASTDSGGTTGGTGEAGDSGSGSSGTDGAGTGGMSGTGEAGTSGTGEAGTAGTTAPKCTAHPECDNPTPQCNSRGVCVACNNNAACAARDGTPRCDARLGSTTRGQCVECTGNSQCNDASKPFCSEGTCTACTADEHCASRDATPKCDNKKGSETRGQCVQCMTSADCSDLAAPECDANHTCVPCTSDDACTGREDTTKCNLYEGAAAEGHCVECTGDNEVDACGANSCKRSTGTCTGTVRGSVDPCEACDADSECDPTNARCVVQSFAGHTIGSFCFYVDDDTNNCANMDSARKPFSVPTPTTSIDGEAGSYCLTLSTCQAVVDATTQKDCMTNGTPDPTKCGVDDIIDGSCLPSGKCSYACVQSYDCVLSVGTCSSPGGGGYCQ